MLHVSKVTLKNAYITLIFAPSDHPEWHSVKCCTHACLPVQLFFLNSFERHPSFTWSRLSWDWYTEGYAAWRCQPIRDKRCVKDLRDVAIYRFCLELNIRVMLHRTHCCCRWNTFISPIFIDEGRYWLNGLATVCIHRHRSFMNDLQPLQILKKWDCNMHRRFAIASDG